MEVVCFLCIVKVIARDLFQDKLQPFYTQLAFISTRFYDSHDCVIACAKQSRDDTHDGVHGMNSVKLSFSWDA